jgi:hypothetical protein
MILGSHPGIHSTAEGRLPMFEEEEKCRGFAPVYQVDLQPACLGPGTGSQAMINKPTMEIPVSSDS